MLDVEREDMDERTMRVSSPVKTKKPFLKFGVSVILGLESPSDTLQDAGGDTEAADLDVEETGELVVADEDDGHPTTIQRPDESFHHQRQQQQPAAAASRNLYPYLQNYFHPLLHCNGKQLNFNYSGKWIINIRN